MPGAPQGRPTYNTITHPTNEGKLACWQLIGMITIGCDGSVCFCLFWPKSWMEFASGCEILLCASQSHYTLVVLVALDMAGLAFNLWILGLWVSIYLEEWVWLGHKDEQERPDLIWNAIHSQLFKVYLAGEYLPYVNTVCQQCPHTDINHHLWTAWWK